MAVRRRLQDHPWAQIGSEAVCWGLDKLGIAPPSTRTVERILARAGLAPRPRPRRREPKGVPYPAPPCEHPGDLHQADLVGPRHLDGGLPFVALNAIDVCPHAAGIEIASDEAEATITAALHALWRRLGLPKRLQLDNGKPFVLGSTKLGEIVRICVHQGVTPVFIPRGEPWRNAVVEHFNDTFDKRFFRSERFGSREQLAGRALEFERYHNQNHRYRATGRRTPDEITAPLGPRQPTAPTEIPPGWPRAGRVEFIRFIRSDRRLRLPRRSITVPETLVYRYVTATLDLSIPATQGNLLVHHQGELTLRATLSEPAG